MILAGKPLGWAKATIGSHLGLNLIAGRKALEAREHLDPTRPAGAEATTAVVKRDSRAQSGFEDGLLLTRPDKDAVHMESHGFHLK